MKLLEKEKKDLVEYFIRKGTLKGKRIISAFKSVKRENFVLDEQKKYAYVDDPLPLMAGQTISQPTTVAIMTEALEPLPGQKILEIGTGSGYQAAILSKIGGSKGKIVTIERIPELYEFAKNNLSRFRNVKVILGDGSLGWPKSAPFDRIIVTAAAPKIPETLFSQLKEGGILITPVGKELLSQKMLKVKKVKGKKVVEDLGYFVFVPLIGEMGFRR